MFFRVSFVPLAFATVLVAATTPPTLGAPDMTTPQREAIEAVIHDYLMQHPDFLIEVLGDHIVPGAIDLDALKKLVTDVRKR